MKWSRRFECYRVASSLKNKPEHKQVSTLLYAMVCHIGEVVTQPANFKEEFPQLFTGLGRLKTEYRIKLNPVVKPVCLFTPRRIPHPLLPKVKRSLYRLKSLHIMILVVKQSLQQMPHQLGSEQFSFRPKTIGNTAPSATSHDPLLRLKRSS